MRRWTFFSPAATDSLKFIRYCLLTTLFVAAGTDVNAGRIDADVSAEVVQPTRVSDYTYGRFGYSRIGEPSSASLPNDNYDNNGSWRTRFSPLYHGLLNGDPVANVDIATVKHHRQRALGVKLTVAYN